MADQPQTEVLQQSLSFVLAKCDYYADVRLWPLVQKLNPRKWLSNFSADEMDHALSLLNAFLYFDKPMMDQLLVGTIQELSRQFCVHGEPFLGAQAKWRNFIDSAVFTCVRGENPNATDSGFTFLRMARQLMNIPEDRIVEPHIALALLMHRKAGPIIFLDDFVGSGEQFIKTWKRKFSLGGTEVSFELLVSLLRGSQFIYCPLVCTAYGLSRIVQHCPTVIVHPAHVLGDEYSALSPNSMIWPSALRASATAFIETASKRAGIPGWKGFHGLGLTIAFEHSVPDATLPIIHFNKNGWKPLIERT